MSDAIDPGTQRMLWRFAPMIYGPTVLFGLGEGALLPLLPVIAAGLGANVAQAALIASALVVARLIGNLPAGWAVARFGERLTMAGAGAVALVGVIGVVYAPDLPTLGVSAFGIGLCASALGLARHSFMTTRVPLGYRARALSVLGGSFRLGFFAGPFIAVALLALFERPESAAWFFAGCLVALVLLVMLGRDPEAVLAAEGHSGTAAAAMQSSTVSRGVFRTAWRHRDVLARLGVSAATLSAMRQARVYLLPLWGLSIGLGAADITLVVGITGALEFALFYSSGQVMDRWGRLWAALPSMVIMGVAFLGLAFTHDLPDAAAWFVAAAVLVGIGNGFSAGILMTLGADVAPADDPAPFLGSWRTLTDAGGAAAPLIVTVVTTVASLSVATMVIGAIGVVGAVGFAVYVPRFVGAIGVTARPER